MLESHSLAYDYFAETEEIATAADRRFHSPDIGDITWSRIQQPKVRGAGLTATREMDWGQFEEDASGCFVGLATALPQPEDAQEEAFPESRDRIILLSKKYASFQLTLSREDKARLEMINQIMDIKYPRYSAKDWELLAEAEALLQEISNESEQPAE